MRKFTLLLALTAFVTFGFAQEKAKLEKSGKVKTVTNELTKTSVKGIKGEVIWSEDFDGERWSSTVSEWGYGYQLNTSADLPAGWAIVDELDFNYFWHWSDLGPRGTYTGTDDDDCHTPDQSTLEYMPDDATIANGVMMMESDYYNSTEDCELSPGTLGQEAYIVYGPIDFSDYSAVVFDMNMTYRFCCSTDDGLYMDFSTDYDMASNDGTWENTIFVSATTDINDWTASDLANYMVNVTAAVGGKDNVYFRLRQSGASHYVIMLDDLKFIEPEEYDVLAEDHWAYYLFDADDPDYTIFDDAAYNFYGGYTVIPQPIVEPFVKFKAAVVNNGIESVSNAKVVTEVYYKDELTETFTGDGSDLTPGQRDTLFVETNYTPSELGNYKVALDVAIDETDGAPENTKWEYDFTVGQATYSRVYRGTEESFGNHSPRGFANGGYDGDAMMQPFNITSEVTVKGINVYIDDYTDRDEELVAIENGEFGMIAKIWQDGDEFVDLGISSDYYILEVSDTATWVYLEFTNGNLTLEGDEWEYLVGIEVYTGTGTDVEDPTMRYLIGTDPSIKQPVFNGGVCYLASQSSLAYNSPNYAIELVLEGDVQPVDVTFNYDLSELKGIADGTNGWFNPAEDVIYLTGSMVEWAEPGTEGSVMMTDEDGDYIYTATVADVAANTTIQYKHFVNAGWDGGEWTGDPNRTAEIKDWDLIINDEVKDTLTSLQFDALAEVSIYPNPFSSELNVEGLDNVETVMVISMVGQVIETIPAANAAKISTANLESGVYFVTFVGKEGETRTMKVVKK